MDRIDALLFGQHQDTVHIQVGLNGPFSVADLVGFIRLETVQTEAIFLGIDSHRSQSQLGGGSHNSDGDFAAIQGEELFHVGNFRVSWNSRDGLLVIDWRG